MRYPEPPPHRPRRPLPHVASEYRELGAESVAAELCRLVAPRHLAALGLPPREPAPLRSYRDMVRA